MKVASNFLFAYASLVAILLLTSGCGLGKQKHAVAGAKRYLYAKIKGEMLVQGRKYRVDRVFLADDSLGVKMVSSYIVAVENIEGYATEFAKQLNEFCHNDSLYVFDSSDSTLMTLRLDEFQSLGIKLLPYSASWIFGCSITEQQTSPVVVDTSCFGLPCKHYINGNLEHIIYGSHNLTFRCELPYCTQNEYVIKLVTDTVIPPEAFLRPKGFRVIQYARQNLYSFSD